jgi:anti-sigma regulatory factor (Ser/Thr protein kinase)
VVNLLTNARYAVEQKHRRGVRFAPRISVSSRDLGAQVELRVRDNGVGVPAAIRERVFVPFFTTKPTGEGTGLGLSITHDIIVRGHAGQIRVESEEGEFTEFVVLLPKRQRKSGLAPAAGLAQPQPPTTQPSSTQLTGTQPSSTQLAGPALPVAELGAQNETSRMPRRI